MGMVLFGYNGLFIILLVVFSISFLMLWVIFEVCGIVRV